jgi:hypothetical protein
VSAAPGGPRTGEAARAARDMREDSGNRAPQTWVVLLQRGAATSGAQLDRDSTGRAQCIGGGIGEGVLSGDRTKECRGPAIGERRCMSCICTS